MRTPHRFLFGLVGGLLLIGGLSCISSRRERFPSGLREPDRAPSAAMSGCSTCHVDVEILTKGSKHLLVGIGCADCHGKSERHILDENNKVKPDRVFSRADINSFCDGCHECALPAEKRPPPKVCTDCHPAHSTSTVTERVPGGHNDAETVGGKLGLFGGGDAIELTRLLQRGYFHSRKLVGAGLE